MRLLRCFIIGEAESLSWHLGDKSFAETETGLNIDLVLFAVRWVRCVDDIGILCRHNLLDKNCHVDLVQTYTDLLGSEESALVKLARPYHLDCLPCSCEVLFWDTKRYELLLKVSVLWV